MSETWARRTVKRVAILSISFCCITETPDYEAKNSNHLLSDSSGGHLSKIKMLARPYPLQMGENPLLSFLAFSAPGIS